MSRTFAEVIRASAGTGKTFSLTNRLLFLVLKGEDPSTILATTFTRKAAGEIRERLLTRLADACLSETELRNLGEALGLPAIDRSQCLMALSTLIKEQHRLKISTLDSFFMQIARSFGLEVGLPVKWSVLDAGRSGALVRESVQQLLRGLDPREAALFIRLCSRGDIKRSVAAELESHANKLFERYRESTADAWKWLDTINLTAKINIDEEVSKISQLELPLTQKGKPNATWQKAISAALECLRQKDCSSYLDRTLVRAIATGGDTFNRVQISEDLRNAFLPSIKYARQQVLISLRDQALSLQRILGLFSQQLERIKFSRGLLGFSDIKYHLWQNPGYEELNDLYFRLDSTISHLLLDEFQDTSFSEWRILEPLVEEILSKADGTKSFFCVGDVKQAIYGWRGGVAEIFDSICDRWEQLSETPLDISYRSSREVIDAVNKVFSGIGNNSALGESEAPGNWSRRFTSHKTAREDLEGYVLAFSPECEDEDLEDKSSGCFPAAASLMKQLHSLNPDLEIAVLVRTNEHVKLMMDAIRACDPGLQVSEEGGNSLASSPTVRSILAALSLIDNPLDKISAFHVASTRLGEIVGLNLPVTQQKSQKLAHSLRRQLVERGLAGVLSDWLRLLKESGLSRAEARKVENLIVFAGPCQGEFALRPSEFVRYVATQKVEDSRAAKLRVMTIHQSKGLEFDAVILPDLDRALNGSKSPPLLEWRPGPLSLAEKVVPHISEKFHYIEPVLGEMNSQYKTRTLEEDLSVFYVALTRAKNALYMLLAPSRENEKKIPMSYAGILRVAFEKEELLNAGDVLYESGNPGWHRTIAHENAGLAGLPTQVEEYLGNFKSDYRRPVLTVVSPSSTPVEGENLDRLLTIFDGSAADQGVLVHALLEKVSWMDESLPDLDQIADSIKGPFIDKELLARACGLVSEAFKRPDFLRVFQRERFAEFERQKNCRIELFCEKRFAVKDGAKIISGTFDRLVLLVRENTIEAIEIVDFKTTASPVVEDSVASRYTEQMKSYAKAASLMFKTAPEAIKTELVYVK